MGKSHTHKTRKLIIMRIKHDNANEKKIQKMKQVEERDEGSRYGRRVRARDR